jgi:predicted metal-dependent peptidase
MLMVNQLTEEQRLTKAVVSIMGNPKYIYLAGVLMIGERDVVDDPSIPTACTNGRDEFYGREFLSKLNDAELRFLVLHEVYHKLFRHLTTWKHLYMQDAHLANVACDYVINLKIVDDNYQDGFATMTGELVNGCYDRKYVGMDTAQVYNLLRKDQPQGVGRSGGDGDGDPEDGDGTPEDGSGSLPNGHEPFDAHDWDGAQEMTADEQRDLAREIDEAVRQGALVAGKMGSGGDRSLSELLEPQVDWREVLREFVQTTCTGSDYSTYRRPNRRYLSSGIYMPSGVSEKVGELVVAIDTSGSIEQPEITAFLSEVKAICDTVRPDKVRLLYWDTKICRDETYDTHELDTLVQSTKPEGGGGTDVECVTEYIREESITAQACIVITDGDLYSGWGQWTMPVLWCVIDNKLRVPDVGKCVHIKSRDM